MKQRFTYPLLFFVLALALGLALVGVSQLLFPFGSAQAPQQTPATSASSAESSAPNPADRAPQSSAISSGAGSSSAQSVPALSDAIMGESLISAETMAALYHEHGAEYPARVYEQAGAASIEEFCLLCTEEAQAEGVRAEVLFAQAMHETAWLQFGNQVSVEQNNFGGLGAVNDGGPGASFETVAEGLRAQVQHLKAYASEEDLKQALVDPRFDLVERGSAPTVQDLGGRWAWPGDGYGDAIMAIIQDLYDREYNEV